MVEKYNKLVLLLIFFSLFLTISSQAEELKEGKIHPDVMQTVFSGYEEMHYTISWTGGIKIGDLLLTLKQIDEEQYEINARITDYGLFKFFYPVDDTFVTLVRGAFKLPYRYDVLQKEGRGSVTRRQEEKVFISYDSRSLSPGGKSCWPSCTLCITTAIIRWE